ASGDTQPLRRLLAAMEDAAGPELYRRILDVYIDDYYGNDLHRPLEELARQEHRNMSWQPSTNGWWIEMRSCPFPYWKGNPTVCEAETRVLSQHWKVPVINIADDGERMRCRFFIPIRPSTAVLSPDGTEGQK
ncbi:MAG: hypothetical protein OWV35_10865, partial [Firmicutes bacterium]|nr:hypothetical protein [Bacillota bacterium]